MPCAAVILVFGPLGYGTWTSEVRFLWSLRHGSQEHAQVYLLPEKLSKTGPRQTERLKRAFLLSDFAGT